jgi:mono/diheme cytochrome c family protein
MTTPVAVCLAVIIVLSGPAAAQDADARAGRLTAETNCAECHGVRAGQLASPAASAPSFEKIANTPGMSPLALQAALQTSHRTMPNVMLEPGELRDIVGYILTLKRGN